MAYLLFAGADYYPRGGANDFKGQFDTVELAIEAHDHYEFCDGGWAHVFCLKSLSAVKFFYSRKWFDDEES